MPVIKREALVIHTPAEMFALVNDVENYPQFLPWCPKTEIHHKTDHSLEATIYVQKGPVKFHFRTQNTNIPNHEMEMVLIDGPFKSLNGKWHFIPLGSSGCKIEFTLAFEFSHAAIGLSLSPVMKYIADTLLNAFCDHADKQ